MDDKDRLPKLEIEGFKNAAKPSPIRKEKTAGISRWKTVAKRNIKPDAQGAEDKPGESEIDVGYKRLLVKTGICAAIAIIILVISSINTPAAQDVTQAINQAVNHEFDIEEDIGRLKFVQNLDEDLQSVFSPLPDAAVVFPADGSIVTHYGDGGSKGVRIAPAAPEIACIAKGTVTSVGEIDEKGYVKVVLDSGETAVFYNISPSVKVDDIVMPGQPIGEVDGDYLYIEMMDSDDEYIDPVTYIEQRAAIELQ